MHMLKLNTGSDTLTRNPIGKNAKLLTP